MARYTFENLQTGEIAEHEMKMAEYDDFVAANPHLRRVWSAIPQGDPIRLGITKTPDSWKSLLKNVAKQHRNAWSGGTNINVR